MLLLGANVLEQWTVLFVVCRASETVAMLLLIPSEAINEFYCMGKPRPQSLPGTKVQSLCSSEKKWAAHLYPVWPVITIQQN